MKTTLILQNQSLALQIWIAVKRANNNISLTPSPLLAALSQSVSVNMDVSTTNLLLVMRLQKQLAQSKQTLLVVVVNNIGLTKNRYAT
jgi:hypothetical protein